MVTKNDKQVGGDRVSYMARLLQVLEAALESTETSRPLSALCEQLDLPKSTTSRLVNFLVDQGMLTGLGTGAYGPGPRMFQLAIHTLDQLRETDRLDEASRELSAVTGESVSIGLIVGDRILLVSRCEPETTLRAVARVGDIIQPHTSAMGKAILAACPEKQRPRIVSTADPIRQAQILDDLDDELVRVTACGYAVDEETYTPGLRCRAAAIRGKGGSVVGAISIAGPASRYSYKRAEDSVESLRAQAASLSTVIAYH